MKKFGLPAKSRVKRKKDFSLILRKGRKTENSCFTLWWEASAAPDAPARLGIIVSKKHGGAVERSRLKRLIREVFRINRERIVAGTSVILRPRGNSLNDYRDMETAIFAIWRKAGLFKENGESRG